ncbi:hypothetical protein HOO68_05385 [Candidatus Gracilibacteria bacterium]|nr:hypothetical protein [Candidatus Gracilibacteria bacterium]
MKKYYSRRRYNQGGQIKSFRDLVITIIQIAIGTIGLILLIYLIPIYLYIITHPIFLIPVVFVIVLISGIVFWYIQKRKAIRYQAVQKFAEIMKLDWREFEEFVAEILKQKGFHTILGAGIKDGGIDVTATLGDKKFFIQCKHYGSDNISVEKIRELNGVMNGETIPVGGIFVTTTGFTPDAISEANRFGIDLWDKNYLKRFLEESNMDIKKQKDDYGICESCGGKLVLRTAHAGANNGGNFLGCEMFPKCRFTKNI